MRTQRLLPGSSPFPCARTWGTSRHPRVPALYEGWGAVPAWCRGCGVRVLPSEEHDKGPARDPVGRSGDGRLEEKTFAQSGPPGDLLPVDTNQDAWHAAPHPMGAQKPGLCPAHATIRHYDFISLLYLFRLSVPEGGPSPTVAQGEPSPTHHQGLGWFLGACEDGFIPVSRPVLPPQPGQPPFPRGCV